MDLDQLTQNTIKSINDLIKKPLHAVINADMESRMYQMQQYIDHITYEHTEYVSKKETYSLNELKKKLETNNVIVITGNTSTVEQTSKISSESSTPKQTNHTTIIQNVIEEYFDEEGGKYTIKYETLSSLPSQPSLLSFYTKTTTKKIKTVELTNSNGKSYTLPIYKIIKPSDSILQVESLDFKIKYTELNGKIYNANDPTFQSIFGSTDINITLVRGKKNDDELVKYIDDMLK